MTTTTTDISNTARVARHVKGVFDSWDLPDGSVLIAANDQGRRALTRAVGIVNVEPVAAEDLPRFRDVDWSALRGHHNESQVYRVGQLDARQRKALAAAAEGDHRAVA